MLDLLEAGGDGLAMASVALVAYGLRVRASGIAVTCQIDVGRMVKEITSLEGASTAPRSSREQGGFFQVRRASICGVICRRRLALL